MDEWAGGPWTNFLDRYDEAGRLHTWMTGLSEACRERGDPETLRCAVGKAQCNDAYWHGVFGGLYMKHLREGVRGWMAAAERELRSGAPLTFETARDRRGREEHWVHSEHISARVSGVAGGTLTELVWLGPHVDVSNTLTRRLEAYHEEAVARGRERRLDASDSDHESASIHEIEGAATLDRLPPVDPAPRFVVRERVLPPDTTLESYIDGTFDSLWTGLDGSLAAPEAVDSALKWRFSGDASGDTSGQPTARKSITVADDRVEIEWTWDAAAFPDGALFAPELSLGCPVDLVFDPQPEEVWRYPIVTVSKCPDGFEEIEQGTSVTPRWPATLGRAKVVLRPPREADASGGD